MRIRLRLAHLVLGLLTLAMLLSLMALQTVWLRLNRLSTEARDAGLAAHARHGGDRPQLLIIDLTRPSFAKRGHLVHLEDGVQESFLVAHGMDSGWSRVTRVGDRPGSRLTPAGPFRVGAVETGPHGPQLPLTGLDPLQNGEARARGIAVHGQAKVAWATVWETGGRLIRSDGEPMVPHAVMPALEAALAEGGLVYVHWEEHRGAPSLLPADD